MHFSLVCSRYCTLGSWPWKLPSDGMPLPFRSSESSVCCRQPMLKNSFREGEFKLVFVGEIAS